MAVQLGGVILGAVIYTSVYQVIIFAGFDTDLLKMFSAVVVAVSLGAPHVKAQLKAHSRSKRKETAAMLKMNNITKTFNSGTVDERVALDHLEPDAAGRGFRHRHRRQRRRKEHHAERHLRHLAARRGQHRAGRRQRLLSAGAQARPLPGPRVPGSP